MPVNLLRMYSVFTVQDDIVLFHTGCGIVQMDSSFTIKELMDLMMDHQKTCKVKNEE